MAALEEATDKKDFAENFDDDCDERDEDDEEDTLDEGEF